MDAYIDLVNRLAESNSPDIVNNSSLEHAVAIFATMFNKRCGEARVLSGGLNPLVYGREEVRTAVTNFLSKDGNTLEVVIQGMGEKLSDTVGEEDIRVNPLVTHLKEKLPKAFDDGRIQIKMAGSVLMELESHFTTIGDAFRFEPDRKEKRAFASFNRPDMVKRLNSVWKSGYSEASQISI